ncbi:MAG: hypothetical protein KAJ95_03360, partial [Gammaproteobacteria bacterium]|nr:hypothetical protein [Gammaproteobacteria bacterium]
KRFLQAFRMSWYNYAKNPEVVNQQFSKQSRLNVSDAVLDEAASIEPNRWTAKPAEQGFLFDEGDIKVLHEAQKYLLGRNILKTPLDIPAQIDTTIMQSLLEDDPGISESSGIKAR